tara:strand:+ start:197 stop:442 length:246 start_codon:yes stop_codon:yes gene_type:complete
MKKESTKENSKRPTKLLKGLDKQKNQYFLMQTPIDLSTLKSRFPTFSNLKELRWVSLANVSLWNKGSKDGRRTQLRSFLAK